jgi:hypothetical protein
MMPILLSNLPYLVVYIVGLKMAIDRRDNHPQLAAWGIGVYSVMIVVCVARILQSGWMIFGDGDPDVFQMLSRIRMAVSYLSYAALVIGVFCWRREMGEPFTQPAICAGVSIVLIILSIQFGYNLMTLPFVGPVLVFIIGMGAEIFILMAFYGWRSGHYVADTGPSGETGGVEITGGMFKEEDFIPYVAGIMVLGGLVCVPILWSNFMQIDYLRAIVSSLVSCGIFAYAHDKRGNFSVMKFLTALVSMVLIVMRTIAQNSPDGGQPMFMAGGLVGFAVMFGCGWAGIAIGRLFRR